MTIRMTGYVLPKEKSPPRIWSRRKSTPTVVMTAGPISPRIVQRRHAQRIRSLIDKSLLRTAVEPLAHQQNSRANQKNRPNGALFGKSIERVGQSFSRLPRFGRAVGINGHVDP